MNMRRTGLLARTWLIVIAAVLVIGGGLRLTVFSGDDDDYDIVTVPVSTGPLVMTIETNGTLEPLSTVQVGCEVTGRILEMAVDDDGPVAKDQVICRIDPELAQAQHEQSVAELNRAKSAFAEAELVREERKANLPVATAEALARKQEAEAALVEAEFNLKRVEKLFADQHANETEVTAVRAGHKRAEAAVTAAGAAHKLAKNNETFLFERAVQAVQQAEAAEKLAQARFDSTKTQLEKCVIRSPIDGIVLKRHLDAGATVTAAFQTPILYTLAPDLRRMRVSAKVSESDIGHVEIGQTARFTVDVRGRRTFTGTISAKHNQPDIVQNVVTYTVEFEVDNDDRRTLLPGLTANVEIECVNRPSAVRIPNAALRFKPPLPPEERQTRLDKAAWPPEPTAGPEGRPPDYCSKAHAWRFDPAGREWTLVPLWIGITDNAETEVLAGARPGDEFVKQFTSKSSDGFSFKEMLKLADPSNRRVL